MIMRPKLLLAPLLHVLVQLVQLQSSAGTARGPPKRLCHVTLPYCELSAGDLAPPSETDYASADDSTERQPCAVGSNITSWSEIS